MHLSEYPASSLYTTLLYYQSMAQRNNFRSKTHNFPWPPSHDALFPETELKSDDSSNVIHMSSVDVKCLPTHDDILFPHPLVIINYFSRNSYQINE